MTFDEIDYALDQRVALITLKRPERMNAMTLRMGGEIRAALQQASDDPQVRAIVLTGAGRGFCAGADAARLQNRADSSGKEAEPLPNAGAIAGGLELPDGLAAKYSYLASVPKPVIAAVNGAAVGVGLVLALYCDIRFAAREARFGTAFARRGLVAEYGAAWLLPRLIGPARAFDLLYSARLVEAEEAASLGLVDRVLDGPDLLPAALDYARELAAQSSPRSLRVIKQLVWRGLNSDVGAAVAEAEEETAAALASDDFREGVAAWQEKRPPRFPDL